MKIAIVGGTGDMGFGLGLRLGKAGHEVLIGSRSADKANEAATLARTQVPQGTFSGGENTAVCQAADLVVISVPTAGHRATIESLKEVLRQKPVLDITVPMAFGPLRYAPPIEGSNAEETEAILGEGCRVAAGFHTVSATLLADVTKPVEVNALVCGNNADLRAQWIALGGEIGITAYDAGTLNMACALESQTPMLIGMNKRYGSKHIGFQMVGF